jgi:hypothetical protein
MVVERFAFNELFSAFICSGEITPLNRDNEISLKLSSDNFCTFDLLSEHNRRFALSNEPVELRPEVSFVFFTFSLTGT